MSRPMDLGLRQVSNLLVKMGRLSIKALKVALDGFFEGEDAFVQASALSNTLLILSEEVEDKATELMALYQPMATDLRLLKAYLKVAYDLERFGRYAMDISDIGNGIGTWEPVEEDESFREMGRKAVESIEISVKLIETMDEQVIWDLSRVESEIDTLYLENLKKLAEIQGDSRTVIAYMLTVRYLERIADHASYISESIGYALTGKRFMIR